MPRRLTALLIAAIAVGLFAAATALAALSDEVTAGQTVAARLQSGQASCQNLSSSDFEHLGEYVMDRTVGSRAAHDAMNARMDQRWARRTPTACTRRSVAATPAAPPRAAVGQG